MDTMVYPKAVRVEVIDAEGRVFVRYYKPGGVMIQVQDDEHTVKIFAGEEIV